MSRTWSCRLGRQKWWCHHFVGREKNKCWGSWGGHSSCRTGANKIFRNLYNCRRQGVKKKSLVKKRLEKKRFGKKSWRKRSERVGEKHIKLWSFRGEELQTRGIPSTWVTICSRSRAANKWFCCKTLVCGVTKDCWKKKKSYHVEQNYLWKKNSTKLNAYQSVYVPWIRQQYWWHKRKNRRNTHCVGPQRLNCWCWRWGEKSIPFDQKSNIGAWQQWQCCGGEGGSAETAAVLSMLFCCCGRCLVGRVLQTPECRNSQCNRYNSAKSVKNLQKSFRMRKT